MSKLLDTALDLATAGETPNEEGAHLLLGWLRDSANDRSLDRPRVKAAVDRYYAQQPGANVPVAASDVYVIAPHGRPPSTRGERGER